MSLVGQKSSGKSSVLINMLINKDMLAGKFNRIFFISPTAKLDTKITSILTGTPGIVVPNKALIKKLSENKKLKPIVDAHESGTCSYNTSLTDEDFLDDIPTDFLKQLCKEQSSVIEKYGKGISDKFLVIFDDMAAEKEAIQC
jgi:hypothetical protein